MKTGTNYPFKFSIVMAAYNVEIYLEEAINSILHQNIGFTESVQLIIVDDGSTDKTAEICDIYKAKYPNNIRYLYIICHRYHRRLPVCLS